MIDAMVGAPGHGKDEVDGLNAVNKTYLKGLISKQYGFMIDAMVGAPGHGKDEVDGLNAVNKTYL